MLHARIQRGGGAGPGGGGGGGGGGLRLKHHKNIAFLSNTSPDPLSNHNATKPVFNCVPSSPRQQNAIEMAFRWRADDDPLILPPLIN